MKMKRERERERRRGKIKIKGTTNELIIGIRKRKQIDE
jgi:hypothetical protein